MVFGNLGIICGLFCFHNIYLISSKNQQISKSLGLREAFKCQGYDIPKDPTTIRELFMEEYRNVKAKKIEELKSRVESGERFSLTVDEASGVKNRRYKNFVLYKL